MSSLQGEIEQRGERIFELVDRQSRIDFHQGRLLSTNDGVLDAGRAFQGADVSLCRCPGVAPERSDIVQHLGEYFADMRNGFVPVMQTGLRCARVMPWLSGRDSCAGMFPAWPGIHRRQNPDDVMKMLRKRRKERIGFTVDLLGEAVVSEKEATNTRRVVWICSRALPPQTRGWTDPLGSYSELFPVVNVSVKISALYSQMNPADPADAIAHLAPELRPILRRARELGAFVNFDMESYAHKNTTLELFKPLVAREANFGIGRMPASSFRPICAMPSAICAT